MKSLLYCVSIIVSVIIFTPWDETNMVSPRANVSASANDQYVIFAGGNPESGGDAPAARKRVEILNTADGSWTELALSVDRQHMRSEIVGNKAYFAGYTQTFIANQDVVEVLDLENMTWSQFELPTVYGAQSMTATDDQLFFVNDDNVDIYTIADGSIESHTLSEYRILPTAQACNGKVIFAGGGSLVNGTFDLVDIYDIETGTWTTDKMSKGKNKLTTACHNSNIYIVGGAHDFSDDSNIIEVYHTDEGTWEIIELSNEYSGAYMASNNEYLYISREYPKIERLEFATHEIDLLDIPSPRVSMGVTAALDKVYFAGGLSVSSFDIVDKVEIYTETLSSIEENTQIKEYLNIYPNPTSDFLHIDHLAGESDYTIQNIQGQLIQKGKTFGRIDVVNLPTGNYILELEGNSHKFQKK